MAEDRPRLLILGAHPDDADFAAGGMAALYRELDRVVKMVSVTNGGAGHHELAPDELVHTRRAEAAASGNVIGAEYTTWDFPDGSLQPTLEVRERIIREIRSFKPDLVLTHRTNDYHPDHRAVGQAVQDASFMVNVPLVVPDTPALRGDPVVAYMPDRFTKPCPLEPHVVVDTTPVIDTVVRMLDCHKSQVYQWLPYLADKLQQVPDSDEDRIAWLKAWWMEARLGFRTDRFEEAIQKQYGAVRAAEIAAVEVYEISEYAAPLDEAARARLFPFVPASAKPPATK